MVEKISLVPRCNSWDKVKPRLINIMKKNGEVMFGMHNKNVIEGKAQLMYDTIRPIPVVIKTEKIKNKVVSNSYKFIDDFYDRRSDGYEVDTVTLNFWMYKVVSENQEYFVLSQEKLNGNMYRFAGMKIKMNNMSEISKSLKLRSLSNLFIVHSAEEAIKVLDKKDLIEFVSKRKKKYGWNKKGFCDFVLSDEDGKIYDSTEEANMIKIVQLLSGKYEKYPLHLLIMGPTGTGKTTGLECLDNKFQEIKGIMEAGSSTPKALIPSYKEKPANPGYIMNCVRLALVDELMKMVSNVSNTRYEDLLTDYFSKLNPILEQKKRNFGSGNDNSFTGQSTAKVIISTNPLQGRNSIYEHIGIIDPSTAGRLLIWVQNDEEQKVIDNRKTEKINTHKYICQGKNNKDNNNVVGIYYGVFIINDFLTIYDSCQAFLCNFDMEIIKTIVKTSIEKCQEPMKEIWKARAVHHSVLLLDGIVKHRCLFEDEMDGDFTAKKEDYETLERLLSCMIDNWSTKFGEIIQFN